MTVELVDSMGSDLSVVNAARVSFHKWHDEVQDNDPKLIAYLAKHHHWTPFGHAFLSYRIKAPIFVARQLVKHQVGLVWNEVSRRYVDEEPEFWFPETYRGRPTGNIKQGSSGQFSDTEIAIAEEYVEDINTTYLNLVKRGMAPEQARMFLPQNTMTEWIWSGSLAAFARVVRLRTDSHAQQETQEIAKQIDGLVPEQFKHSWKALLGRG